MLTQDEHVQSLNSTTKLNTMKFMKIIYLLILLTSITILGHTQTKDTSNCIIPHMDEVINGDPASIYTRPFKSHCYNKSDSVDSYSLVDIINSGEGYYGGHYLYLFNENNTEALSEIEKLKQNKRYTYYKQGDFLELLIDTLNKKLILFETNKAITDKHLIKVLVWEEFKLADLGTAQDAGRFINNKEELAYNITDQKISEHKKNLFTNSVFRKAIEPVQVALGCNNFEYRAAFPGGLTALKHYLSQNLDYPKLAVKKRTQGIVRVQFVIYQDGSINEVEALNDPGDGLAEEAIRVIKNMPKWEPAEQKCRKVKYKLIQNINFHL